MSNTELTALFEWRDQRGEFYRPADMESSHLFHVVKMIWNHSMPIPARFENYRRYRFGRFYTRDYMMRAVRILLDELFMRPDLHPSWIRDIERMADWIRANGIKLIDDKDSL